MDFNASEMNKIRFCTTESKSYSLYKSIKPLHVEGHYQLLVQSVLQKFKWNYDGMLTKDGMDLGSIYGKRNGSGMVGFLLRNEADIGFNTITPSYENAKFLDFTTIIHEEDWSIVSSGAPLRIETSDFSFTNIFSASVWIAFSVSLSFVAVFWSFAETIKRKICPSHKFRCRQGFLNKLLAAFGISVNENTNLPSSQFGPLRFAVICWILVCFQLNIGFGGSFVSKLSLPPQLVFIETMRDILNHKDLPVLIIKNTPPENYLKVSPVNVERRIWKRVKYHRSVRDPAKLNLISELKEIALDQQVTFFPNHVIKEGTPLDLNCSLTKKLHLSSKGAFRTLTAFPLRKDLNPKLASVFKRTVQTLFETGLILRTMWMACWKNSVCFDTDAIPQRPLTVSNFCNVINVLYYGYTIASLVCFFEFFKIKCITKPSRYITDKGNGRVVTCR